MHESRRLNVPQSNPGTADRPMDFLFGAGYGKPRDEGGSVLLAWL